MKSIGPQSSKTRNPPVMVVKETSRPGGAVNLILNLSNTGDSLVQVPDQPAQAGELLDETAEPVHRVRNSLISSYQKSTNSVLQLHHLHPLLYTFHISVLWPSCPPPLFFFFSSLPQHAVPHFSAYKNFWRRCQGLLENTLGSLMRKKRIYRQSASEVKRVKNGSACCIFRVCQGRMLWMWVVWSTNQ